MNEKLLDYRGYKGSVEYSKEDDCLFGKVLGIKSLLSYEGKDECELKKNFEETVDDYLIFCEQRSIIKNV